MSIKKSLNLSLLLFATLPLIVVTAITYIISYNKYLDMAKVSATEFAKNNAEGLDAQLNIQIAMLEGLSNSVNIQYLTLESYNGLSLGTDSSYYTAAMDEIESNADYSEGYINIYLYDINGYYISGTDSRQTGDWEEYMDIPVADIMTTTVMRSANINKNTDSIDIITPVVAKKTNVGLIRANITSDYFSAFVSADGNASVLTDKDDFLFSHKMFQDGDKLSTLANGLFYAEAENGYFTDNEATLSNIYGYCVLPDFDWIYIIRLDDRAYHEIISTVPLILIFMLILLFIITLRISRVLVQKYTTPILTLKDNMTEAAAGHLDIVCSINTDDEFGELSTSFNSMMNIISNNYNQLTESHKMLEANEALLKKNYAHIEHLAYHDGLTGLYNRVAFMKYAHEAFMNSSKGLSRKAIFFIDLDNFKNVNDTLGHDYGDMLLKQVADQLAACIAKEDILARTGGDEFLILKNTYNTLEDLEHYANDFMTIVQQPIELDDELAHVSMSVGIACFPKDGLTISELIKNADIAMYCAKNSGKNSFRFFNSYMEDDVNRRNNLADILETVIENNEVYLNYQPQVNVITNKITGYEALMRINSREVGFIPPTEFIPVAEENGLINELGEWALYEACGFNQSLIDSGFPPLRVSVNISTAQLKDTHLIDTIKSIPEKTGMDLKYLEIEITESVLMDSFEHNLDLINQMKALGATIALDDFGTGYSSFNYLTRIPIDTLKIDKSFIQGICTNEKDRCIADTIISLAHKMNITVVAEGVEDSEQLNILRDQFCDTLQGYLFSKPVSGPEFISLLEKNGKE
ncbi:MAG: EAL domain-containing protein [Clostridium sp.]|nr:EAL domain-containing protein [Clostridium sp.]MCM1398100.1 EAL domain-containing protein [Clostridium sp.]MCM1459266.1 EAL domain-containing protein [Bacteroides sp.]